jgi:hypothetical protein
LDGWDIADVRHDREAEQAFRVTFSLEAGVSLHTQR